MRAFLASIICCALLFALTSDPLWAHQKTKWHDLSTRQKQMTIISAALSDNGESGGQCKTWAQDIIHRASSGHVWLPANSGEISPTWVKDNNGHIADLGKTISSARPGDIVQMIVKGRTVPEVAHTAIVGSNEKKMIVWLESNYRGDEKVTTNRSQKISDFEKSLIRGQYTIYRIK